MAKATVAVDAQSYTGPYAYPILYATRLLAVQQAQSEGFVNDPGTNDDHWFKRLSDGALRSIWAENVVGST